VPAGRSKNIRAPSGGTLEKQIKKQAENDRQPRTERKGKNVAPSFFWWLLRFYCLKQTEKSGKMDNFRVGKEEITHFFGLITNFERQTLIFLQKINFAQQSRESNLKCANK
jgi:hypothetical protein